MEEADALCDKVLVIKEGEIKCIGESLDLKNKYGGGYRMNIMVEFENVGICKEILH